MRDYQDLSTFALPEGFRGKGALTVQLWWGVQATLFRHSPQIFYGWRRFLLRAFGAKIGKGVLVRPTARITYPWKVTIGDWSQVGDGTELYSLGRIEIGAHTVVSQGCYICAAGHDPASNSFAIYQSRVVIEDEVWLASQCFVMPGVTVRKGTFCKVRTLVTSDTEEGTVYAGSPGRAVAKRRDLPPLTIDRHGFRK